MNSITKPREFWIYKGDSNFCSEMQYDDEWNQTKKHDPEGFYDLVLLNDTANGAIHVIEYSAYQAALDEIEALKAKIAELEKTEDDLAKLNCDLEDKCAKYEDALKLFTQVHFIYSFKETEFEIHTEPKMISDMARQVLEDE